MKLKIKNTKENTYYETKRNQNKFNKPKERVFKRDELELYGFGKNEVEVVQIYQKNFPELLQDVDGFVIDARPLWVNLGEPQGEFNKWSKRKIIGKGFIENVDFSKIDKTVDVGNLKRPTTEYTLTVDTAKNIARQIEYIDII